MDSDSDSLLGWSRAIVGRSDGFEADSAESPKGPPVVLYCARPAHATAFPLTAGEPLHLHVFLDRSVVEVFANGRACITDRVYPSRGDSLGVRAFARGGRATLRTMSVWRMKPIWPTGR